MRHACNAVDGTAKKRYPQLGVATRFKRTIRQMMEIFLRFTHRYWFYKVSQQPLAHAVYERLTRELGNEEHYQEVRNEVTDMNQYLDSDSARRQANTVLRLTVVTILGLIGTVASGLLGMNIIAEADKPSRQVDADLPPGSVLVGSRQPIDNAPRIDMQNRAVDRDTILGPRGISGRKIAQLELITL